MSVPVSKIVSKIVSISTRFRHDFNLNYGKDYSIPAVPYSQKEWHLCGIDQVNWESNPMGKSNGTHAVLIGINGSRTQCSAYSAALSIQ